MSKVLKDVVITSALRTPIGKYKGSLKNISADMLGALVIKEAIFKSSLKGEDVDEVITVSYTHLTLPTILLV